MGKNKLKICRIYFTNASHVDIYYDEYHISPNGRLTLFFKIENKKIERGRFFTDKIAGYELFISSYKTKINKV